MTEQAWKTKESEIGYSCDGFDIVSQTVELPDGTEAAFDYVAESPSVVVLPFDGEGRVVVIDEWRQAVERLNRGLPAGTLEDGEDREAGARRELREETGYRAGSIDHLVTVEPANGFSNALFHYFVASGCEPAADQHLDTDETIEVSTATFEELFGAVRDGELRDGRIAFAVLYYALFESVGRKGE